MIAKTPTPHEIRVAQIAEEYRQQGYHVIEYPKIDHLPEFLKQFRPDILAENDAEHVVIEVIMQGKVHPNLNSELAEAIKTHPGWRFEMVLGGGRHSSRDLLQAIPLDKPTLELDQIEERLCTGRQLAESGQEEAALMVLWSAVEATLRWVVRTEEIRVDTPLPANLVTRVYSEGYMDREDYDFLMETIHARNAVAHGLKTEPISGATLERLQIITRRLLYEENVGKEGKTQNE